MRKILGLMLTAMFAMAFEVGTYKCGDINSFATFTIKKDGNARVAWYVYPGEKPYSVERGFWQDKGDAAIIIRKNYIIENIDNALLYDGRIPCEKMN